MHPGIEPLGHRTQGTYATTPSIGCTDYIYRINLRLSFSYFTCIIGKPFLVYTDLYLDKVSEYFEWSHVRLPDKYPPSAW